MKHDVVFSVLALAVLASVLASMAFTILPEGVAAPERSVLEGRVYQVLPEKGVRKALASGEYQRQLERFVSDRAPARDDVMLANAALQRACIAAANAPFGFPAYHSYYGSDRVAVPEVGAVYREPATGEMYSGEFFELARRFGGPIVESADGVDWYYYLPASSEIASANPARGLVSEPFGYGEALAGLSGAMPDGVRFVSGDYSDLGEYAEKLFRTDHHFQIGGALDMYRAVCAATGAAAADAGEPEVSYPGPFLGSNARAGLMSGLADAVWDVDVDLGGISITTDGRPTAAADVDERYRKDAVFGQRSRFENVYVAWFHGDPPLMEYDNPSLPDDAGSLLIVSDSYDSSADRLFARSYRHVYEVDPRHFAGGIPAIAEFVSSHPDIVDGVFVISMDVYNQMRDAGVL